MDELCLTPNSLLYFSGKNTLVIPTPLRGEKRKKNWGLPETVRMTVTTAELAQTGGAGGGGGLTSAKNRSPAMGPPCVPLYLRDVLPSTILRK